MTLSVPRGWFYLLFTLSGFAGLIYESIWSHYLKLFLGHAAYAQTLVLAIFMGGMALGSWVCSRYSGSWRNLLLGYAIAEALIGITALVFHRVFVSTTDFAFDTVIPALASPLAVNAFKWTLSALLILPQSILLGMTFPLMTAGVIRAYPAGTGGAIAMLYFTNSLGAAAGVLASGFALIALVGLPGTMLTAGLINVVLAAIVWLLAKAMPPPPAVAAVARGSGAAAPVQGYRLMLAVSLLTGAASFIYEIGWIRMLSMVLGSSTHAFELMLSAFILGLAFGGLWVKRRIDRTGDPERLLGVVQVAMGVLALGTLVVYGRTFGLMQALLEAIARTDQGYSVFNFGSHLIALLVMFPPAFCAGMTLPLITHVLMRRGAGERAIGGVYAANTVGAITGVFVAVHIGMPVLGLKGLISLGAAIDIGLGLVLLGWVARSGWGFRVAGAVGAGALAATLAWVELDPYKMASGVYRHGRLFLPDEVKVLYHRDGKTATINVLRFPGRLAITTNGKSDAAFNPDPSGRVTVDEPTMILTGALPILLHPQARTAANIGFGSGVSSDVMLSSDNLRTLDSIEIEPAIVEGARAFSPRNDAVYRDPRSRIHIEDAKTFFSIYNRRYDVIASEPSNPWVSGVASLFSTEFYRRVKQHLQPGGLFVQWLQLYEINPSLVASVFRALGGEFSHYDVYAANDTDIIIVARDGAPPPAPSFATPLPPRLAADLARIRIFGAGDLELHRIGGRAALHPYFEGFGVPANSDYFPFLDLHAAQARFKKDDARAITQLTAMPIPALDLIGRDGRRGSITDAPRPWLRRAELSRNALAVRAYLVEGRAEHLSAMPLPIRSDAQLVRLLAVDCAGTPGDLSVDPLLGIGGAMVPFLTAAEWQSAWSRIMNAPCHARLSLQVRDWTRLLDAVGNRDAGRMAELAEQILRRGGGHTQAQLSYLIQAVVAARLARNERDRAMALWREVTRDAEANRENLLPDFLRAHLFSRNGKLAVSGRPSPGK